MSPPLLHARTKPIIIAFLALLACREPPSSGGLPAPSPVPVPDTIKVMAYNVENLFDLVKDGGEYPEYIPGRQNWNRRTHTIKLDNIASVIAYAAADVIVLCEIENANAVSELVQALSRKGRVFGHTAVADRPNTTNTCPAVLSRFPIAGERFYPGPRLGEYFSRNMLEVDILLGSDTLKIFAVHWPSQHNPESTRLEAARPLVERLRQLGPDVDYIIAGDFNTDYDEKSVCAGDRAAALARELGTVRSCSRGEIDYWVEHDLSAGHGTRHYDTWLEVPPEQRFSYVYRKKRCTPDHLLLSPALYAARGLSYVDDSFAVFTWDGKLLRNGQPFRWGLRYREKRRYHRGEGYSDHLPLLLRITRRPFTFRDGAATVGP